MKFASVAIIAVVAVSASANPILRKKLGKTTNPHEITCAEKFSLEATPYTANLKCCDFSMNCDIDKCTEHLCQVQPVETPEKECRMHCEYGFVTKKNGKKICKCADKPETPEKECRMHCEYGFVTKKNGKKICKCADKPEHEKPEHENEYEITCAEKRERNPKALHGRIHKDKACCQWSNKCGKLHKCTQSFCEKDSKPSDVFGDRSDFDFQF